MRSIRPTTILSLGLVLGVVLTLALALLPPPRLPALAQSVPFTPTLTPVATATAVPTVTTAPMATTIPTSVPIVLIATPTAQPATALPTATALPPGYGRDACDPNHDLTRPCAIATETDVANLSFVDDPTDVFSFLLKGGRQYRISAMVSQAGGIDPTMEVFLAGQTEQVLAKNDDAQLGNPSSAITLTVQSDAWYLVRVTNAAPGDPRGKTYTMTARSVSMASAPTAMPSNPDDLIGNAYDATRAVPLAWGVPYDLTMRCPDPRPGACYDGRHTFLRVPIKRGVAFSAVTYDLGAGVDTVLTLYQPDATQQASGNGLLANWREVAANDDVQSGWTLRSQLTVIPTWDSGIALLVVAPSTRSDLPPIPSDGRPGRYRLIIGSPDLPAVKSVLQSQQDVPQLPTVTLRPTGQALDPRLNPTSAVDTREVIREACPTGMAEVQTATGLYAAAPPTDRDQIATYPSGAMVELVGQCYRGWVKVRPLDSVTPGWMWAPDLRPSELANSIPTSANGIRVPETPMPTSSGDTVEQPHMTPTVAMAMQVRLIPLEPLPLSATVAPRPVARQLTITVCVTSPLPGASCGEALAGVTVQLVLAATDQILTSGETDAEGRVTLSVSVPSASAQLLVRLPSLGIAAPIGANTTELPIRIGGTN